MSDYDDYIRLGLVAWLGLFLAEQMLIRLYDWIWPVRRGS